MSPLIVMTLLAAEPSCYWPRDTQPGWKQVTLPQGARYLAAPEDVDQFRTGDTVEVVTDHPGAHLAGSGYRHGRTEFELTPSTGACELQMTFTEPLRGAKVDVTAWGAMGRMTLMQEERVPGRYLRLAWGDPGVRSVSVSVHDHFRDSPVMESWKSTCRTESGRLGLSEAYQLGRSLYYLQPEGRVIQLCNKPDTPMRVRGGSLPGRELPFAVSLRPNP